MGKLTPPVRFVLAAAFAAVTLASASAQFFDDRFPWGGGPQRGWFAPPAPSAPPRAVDYSHAPPPKKYEKNDTSDLSTVMVMGDAMADWLAYGLETAFADSPEMAVLRRHRTGSSLIYAPTLRNHNFDWAANAREVLSKDNASFVVMMIGLSDRDPIREPRQQPAQQKNATPEKPAATDPNKPAADEKPAGEDKADNAAAKDDQDDDAGNAAPERARGGFNVYEFRSDRWVELYTKRIDEVIAALKSRGVPVLWVGLPPIRGTRSMSDMQFLNDLYKSRAEKAGITYVDVWDGFVDESGRFAQMGPDFEGQTRRLRSADGVYFTAAGARKLAHYVEKEIRRLMTPSGPIAIPIPVEPATPDANNAPGTAPDNSVARPLAGPVIPLNASGDNGSDADNLVGGDAAQQKLTDAVAAKVLNQGDALPVPAGRADDFAWPRRAPAPLDADPVVARTTLPITPMVAERPSAPKTAEAEQPSSAAPPKPARPRLSAAERAQREVRRQQRQAQQQQQPQQPPLFFFFFSR